MGGMGWYEIRFAVRCSFAVNICFSMDCKICGICGMCGMDDANRVRIFTASRVCESLLFLRSKSTIFTNSIFGGMDGMCGILVCFAVSIISNKKRHHAD
jgi:hypothetical protein